MKFVVSRAAAGWLASLKKTVQALNVSVMLRVHHDVVDMADDQHTPAESKHLVNGDDDDDENDNKNMSASRM